MPDSMVERARRCRQRTSIRRCAQIEIACGKHWSEPMGEECRFCCATWNAGMVSLLWDDGRHSLSMESRAACMGRARDLRGQRQSFRGRSGNRGSRVHGERCRRIFASSSRVGGARLVDGLARRQYRRPESCRFLGLSIPDTMLVCCSESRLSLPTVCSATAVSSG